MTAEARARAPVVKVALGRGAAAARADGRAAAERVVTKEAGRVAVAKEPVPVAGSKEASRVEASRVEASRVEMAKVTASKSAVAPAVAARNRRDDAAVDAAVGVAVEATAGAAPGERPGGGKFLFVPAAVMETHLVSSRKPVLPAGTMGEQGPARVVLNAFIAKDGTVSRTDVVEGPPGLINSAMAAVSWRRYRPFLVRGQPAAVVTPVTVSYAGRP